MRNHSCPVFIVIAYKGGMGKTITATNLSAALALERPQRPARKVLLIDTDQQGNAARAVGEPDSTEEYPDLAIALVLAEQGADKLAELAELPTAPTNVPGLHLLAGGTPLAEQMDALGQAGGAAMSGYMHAIVEAYRPHYDAIVIDTPASVTHLTFGALSSADLALCSVKTEDSFAYDSLVLIQEAIGVHADAFPPVVLVGQEFDPARRMTRELMDVATVDEFPVLQRGADVLSQALGTPAGDPWIARVKRDVYLRDAAVQGLPVVAGSKVGRVGPSALRGLADDAWVVVEYIARTKEAQ